MATTQDYHHRRHASNTSSSGVLKRAPRANARAWKQEEEDYLLRARSRSIPYKQIAAHLHKTELACRLHYHQMTFGDRRQNSLAVNRARGEGSRSPMSICGDTPSDHVTPSITTPYSPSPRITYSTSPAVSSIKSYTSPATSVGTEWSSPKMYQKCSSGASSNNHGIGLTWQHASSPMLVPSATVQGIPDLGRLLYDYADSSRAFFSTLANQFSQTPAELEAAFRAALNQKSSSLSPQPDSQHLASMDWPYCGSDNSHARVLSEPQDRLSSDLHAPSPKRCTVSSLLNFEKDTASHKWGMTSA